MCNSYDVRIGFILKTKVNDIDDTLIDVYGYVNHKYHNPKIRNHL